MDRQQAEGPAREVDTQSEGVVRCQKGRRGWELTARYRGKPVELLLILLLTDHGVPDLQSVLAYTHISV